MTATMVQCENCGAAGPQSIHGTCECCGSVALFTLPEPSRVIRPALVDNELVITDSMLWGERD